MVSACRQIEKGYTYENRLAELTYKITGEGTDYLSANKNDEKEVPERLDWIAFKNQFFSSVFWQMPTLKRPN